MPKSDKTNFKAEVSGEIVDNMIMLEEVTTGWYEGRPLKLLKDPNIVTNLYVELDGKIVKIALFDMIVRAAAWLDTQPEPGQTGAG